MHRFLPATPRGRALAAFALLTFAVLDVLAILGSELATKLLVYLAGAVLGGAALLLLTRPFKDRMQNSATGRMAGVVLVFASVFGTIIAGTTIAGIPFFPTAAGGYAGFLIFGLALGAGVAVASRLNAPGPSRSLPQPILGEASNPELRVFAIVVGTVGALFAVFFVLYVLLEYVATPLIRSLAT